MKYLLFLLITFATFAQNPAIKIEIDSVTSVDSIPTERKFTINYHIENLTNKEVHFFLNPTILIPNSRASMSKNVIYNLYEHEEKLDLDDVFTNKKMADYEKKTQSANSDTERNKLLNDFLKNEGISLDSIIKDTKDGKEIDNYFLNKNNKELLKSIIKLAPKEVKRYSISTIWNKTRYYKIDDIEFYLNEDFPHYIDLSINLMKEEFKDHLTSDEYQKIIANPNFIKGWFTSNKMEINFKE